jgi:hypothetical protein
MPGLSQPVSVSFGAVRNQRKYYHSSNTRNHDADPGWLIDSRRPLHYTQAGDNCFKRMVGGIKWKDPRKSVKSA